MSGTAVIVTTGALGTEPRVDADVLLGHSSRRMRTHLRRAIGAMGRGVVEFSLEDDRAAVLDSLRVPRALYVLEADHSPEPTLEVAHAIRQRYPHAPILVISTDYRQALLLELFADSALNHCIAKQGAVSAGMPVIDETELIVTCNKLLTRDIFDISKYIRVFGVEVGESLLRRSTDKEAALDELSRFLDTVDCHSMISQAVLMTADELIMNALFNAPRDERGGAKYARLERTAVFSLEPREEVAVKYGCDGRYIAVSVTDHFGSLSREVILRYLRDSIQGRSASIETKAGGAGLGMHMLSRFVTQLVFNVEPGVRTEVIALFYVRNGPRAFREAGRSLNIFMTSNAMPPALDRGRDQE